jgi:threonine dehydrogenase-like Zn-dependent dehydrogenase
MRAAIFNGPHSISVGERPDAALAEPTDAVVRVVLACVCGSDLWYYRGDSPFEPGPIGHEFVGVVEEVGSEVQSISNGDWKDASIRASSWTSRPTSTASPRATPRWTSGARSSRWSG